MATYAIGDIQGCYQALQALLSHIDYQPSSDQLWLAGDLVNRGPQSLEVLRWAKSLVKPPIIVLGNHDIHLLALAHGHQCSGHNLHNLLAAPDCPELLDWLRQQVLLHYDETLGYAMSHAGIYPAWSLAEALDYAAEVEAILRAPDYARYLPQLYGNLPNIWDPLLTGTERWRFILNSFTRMRFCGPAGELDFTAKAEMGSQPLGYLPWFEVPQRKAAAIDIVFGHWSALEGVTTHPKVHAIDTGCAWGKALTALRLEDGQRFSVPCPDGC